MKTRKKHWGSKMLFFCRAALAFAIFDIFPLLELKAQETKYDPSADRSEERIALSPCRLAQPHVLGGHNFLPTLAIPTPFVDTETTLAFIGAYGNYPSTILGSSGALPSNLELATFEPLLNIQIEAFRKLAFQIGISGNVLTGINTSSILIYGASVQTEWTAGALFNLIETDNTNLSLGLTILFPHYFSISPLNIVAQYNRSLAANTPDFASSYVSSIWKPGFRFAYAFNSTFGLIALLGVRVYQFSQNPANEGDISLNFALGLSADLRPETGIPLGLTANYYRNQVLQNNDANANSYSVGLLETYWTQVSIGLELGVGDVLGHSSTIGALIARVYY